MSASVEFPRVVRKFRLGEEPKDCEYWLTLSMKERLDALLDLINRHHGWTNETAPRLARVLTVVERR
jgi:hypothetical protein